MPKYTIKGKAGNVRVDIPKNVDERTRDIIISTVQESLGKEYEKKSLREIDRLVGGLNVLSNHLKKDKLYSKELDEALRRLAGIYLNRGVQLGKRFEGEPEEVLKIIEMEHGEVVKPVLKQLKGDKLWIAEYLLHALIMGKQCYEAGLTVSSLLSIDKRQQYKEQLEQNTGAYIW